MEGVMGNQRKILCGEEKWRSLIVNGRSHPRHGNNKKLERSKTLIREPSGTNKGRSESRTGEEDGTKSPMIIEAEIGGYFVHRMYVDGGSSSEILYEHCFNKFCPEVRSQMVPATTPLVTISIQQNHRKARSKENLGNSVYSSRNAKIPSDRQNDYITEQQDYSIRMHNGFKARSAAARN
ncbi:hypothetical protein Tco_1290437 [Tanacetum coccineum]